MEVRLLEDVDIKWVSLVDHGANRIPFKLVKAEHNKDNVIHSIITQTDKDFEEILKSEEWLRSVSILDVESRDKYVKHVHKVSDEFDPESFVLHKLNTPGCMIVTGTLKQPDPSAVLFKGILDELSIDDSSKAADTMFNAEISRFISSLSRIMELSDTDTAKKHDLVAKAMWMFDSFVSCFLDINKEPIVVKLDERKSEVDEMSDEIKDTATTEVVVEKTEVNGLDGLTKIVEALAEKLDTFIAKSETPVEIAEGA